MRSIQILYRLFYLINIGFNAQITDRHMQNVHIDVCHVHFSRGKVNYSGHISSDIHFGVLGAIKVYYEIHVNTNIFVIA